MVWKDPCVAKFIGENFISLRTTIDTEDYNTFSAKYKTSVTPTVLLLDLDGNEIDRIIGFEEKDRDNYIQNLEDLSRGKNTLGSILTKLEKNPEDIDLNFKLAQKYRARYEESEAQPYFKKVISLDPEDTKGYKMESELMVALHEASSGHNLEPLKSFIATSADEKHLTAAYTTLASYYQRAKEKEKAFEIFEEALQRMPQNAKIMFSYANVIFSYRMESLYEKGLELNQKAKTLDPDLELSTYFILAGYYRLTGNTVMVVETFEEAIQKFPQSFGLKRNYADFIHRNKVEFKYDRGIQLAEIVRDANPRASMSWFILGQLHYLKGDKKKAVESVSRAVELNPKRSDYRRALKNFERESLH